MSHQLTAYAKSSGRESGRCHSGLDKILRTTKPKATISTPNEFPNTASGGSLEYGWVPVAFPLLWKDHRVEKFLHFIWTERTHNKGTENKCTHRVKKSFSLIPEMQAAMLSSNMVPPNHTWTGFRSLRSDMGEQGRRKPATPNTH